MVVIQSVNAKPISDSRGEKTILITLKTNIGSFSASAPQGKSTGKFEVKSYKKSLEDDIKKLKEFKKYFTKERLEKFEDLRKIEDILEGHVGANSFIAFEYALLKAISKEKRKQIWQIINPRTKKFPRLVGNCVGGGKHSSKDKKPDFQEFLLIPKTRTVKKGYELNKKIRLEIAEKLKREDKKFSEETSDEKGWNASLNEKQILEIIRKFKVPFGVDIAASGFYRRKKYHYQNPKLDRTIEEQIGYISNLIKNFSLFYVEDPFEEKDFESFAQLLKKFPGSLIVGDDLTTTNPKRLKKAIEKKSVNAIIIKPNQIGSLLKVKEVCEIAKKNHIKIIFSHRSGETNENILADLAFGFGADFLKCGIIGKEREVKLKRLIEIERKLK